MKFGSPFPNIDLPRKYEPRTSSADLLVYYANKLEREDHGIQPTDIERSQYASSKVELARPGFIEYRLPITRGTLESLAADFQRPPEQWANMQDK